MEALKVVVVGQGIAAAATVAALRGLSGVAVTWLATAKAPEPVKEPQDGKTEPSQPLVLDRIQKVIMLWPNALAALDAIPLNQSITDCSEPVERLDIRGRAGELLWALPTGALGRRHAPVKESTAVPIKAVSRQREPRITLLDELQKTLQGSEHPSPGDNAVVTDDKGDLKIGGSVPDLVIIADGAASKLRLDVAKLSKKAQWSTEAAPSGIVCFAGSSSHSGQGLVDSGTATATQGDGVRFGVAQTPNAKTLSWYAFVRADTKPDISTPERAKQSAIKAVLPLHAPIADVVRETSHVYAKALDLRPPDSKWHVCLGQQHVILLGDAAHGMMPDIGQGCAMALEDAAVLRRCLKAQSELNTTTLAPALASWEEERRPRVERVWRLAAAAAGLGSMKAPSMAREAVMRGPFAAAGLAVLDDLFGEPVVD